MNNIILIGMPASGKSTVGRMVAEKLHCSFIDCDRLIEEREKKSLREIIAECGPEAFNAIENSVNSSICAENSVIATGGSAVYGEEAMAHFKNIGVVFYLKANYKTLSERLKDLKERGVSIKKGFTLKQLYEERIPLYERYADFTIDEEASPLECADKIIGLIKR